MILQTLCRLLAGSLAIVVVVGSVCTPFRPAWADGWHNAALATASLDEWLQDLKREIPDLANRLNRSELQSGRDIEELKRKVEEKGKVTPAAPAPGKGTMQNRLNARQQELLARKANDCLEVLAFMDRRNIFPNEFPNFQLGKIADYRKTAGQLLKAMGPAGGNAVTNQLRAELMGAVNQASDVTKADGYFTELLNVFKEQLANGQISAENEAALAEAASGRKARGTDQLAKQVREALEDAANLPTLLARLAAADNPGRQRELAVKFQKRVATATLDELLTAASSPNLKDAQKTAIVNEVRRKLPALSAAELLALMNGVSEESLQDAAERELGGRSHTFAELEPQLPRIMEYFASNKPQTAQAAQGQLVNAFQRAPMTHCLSWLGKGDARLNTLIWQQVDGRVARADAERKASYADAALAVLGDGGSAVAARAASLDLLGRTKRLEAVDKIVAALPVMPRELWPKCGATLAAITGQNFGPKAGDGGAEVSVAANKWREWLKQRGSK